MGAYVQAAGAARRRPGVDRATTQRHCGAPADRRAVGGESDAARWRTAGDRYGERHGRDRLIDTRGTRRRIGLHKARRPIDNAKCKFFIESLRDECLYVNAFESIDEALQ